MAMPPKVMKAVQAVRSPAGVNRPYVLNAVRQWHSPIAGLFIASCATGMQRSDLSTFLILNQYFIFVIVAAPSG